MHNKTGKNQAGLLAALQQVAGRDRVRLHVPGHGGVAPGALAQKPGWREIFALDMTELPGLDDLHNPRGVLARAQRRAARAFGLAEKCETFYLINGASAGIAALLGGLAGEGDSVLLPRNIHASVLAGLIFSGARPVFLRPGLVPGFGFAAGVPRRELERVLGDMAGAAAGQAAIPACPPPVSRHPRGEELRRAGMPAALLLVSPTYYGVCGDLAALSRLAAQAGMHLLVDEAHGAHFYFAPGMPAGALRCGAAGVVHGLHKTGGSLTQTGLLHLTGPLMGHAGVRRALSLFQSTSPSYILMASLEAAVDWLARESGPLWQRQLERVEKLRRQLAEIEGIELFGAQHLDGDAAHSFDPLRLVLRVDGLGLSGYQFYQLLAEKGICGELADSRCVLLVVGPFVSPEGLEQLLAAVREIAARYRDARPLALSGAGPGAPGQNLATAPAVALPEELIRAVAHHLPRPVLTPRRAWQAASKSVPWAEAVGEICTEYAALYPPGIPLIIPGEEITPEVVETMLWAQCCGINVHGLSDPTGRTVRVISER
ncbi:aminotransferase class I/II-fold pyridoxal phosphate-dependent enzyme [Desulfurispora thermophila]|uniref:aminotransferase class I/II-fold pyridoxal phosphate-dependent enzyme n=1 Tax=Desulfurispora thermophila TaxID=265470 RepID=UPI0014613C3D|nr:hypothetical protein [Desulfurispora thermophila]